MRAMNKEELKKELINLKNQTIMLEEVAEELGKEDPDAAEILYSAKKGDIISAIIAAKFIEIVASFLKIERPEIGTNKLIKK